MRKTRLVLRQQLPLAPAGLLFAALFAALTAQHAHAQATLVVDDDGQGTESDCDSAAAAFGVIQVAVDAAAPGDTVSICPGTYDEQVVVRTDDLTILGAGVGLTVLRPSSVVANITRPSRGTPSALPILLVDEAVGVTVARLTIDGSLADAGAENVPCAGTPFYLGIYYRNSSGRIDDAHVTNVRSASLCAFGIYTESGDGGVANVSVTGNLVDHYADSGVVCNGADTACTITANHVRGEGPVDDEGQAGITIRFGAVAAIIDNVITDNTYLLARGIATKSVGIFLVYAHPDTNPHLLRDNAFAHNDLDVQRLGTAEAFD